MDIKYDRTLVSKDISVEDYVNKYVNVSEFLEYCKACPNYGNLWSCPPFNFDPTYYWNQFKSLSIRGIIIKIDPSQREKTYTEEEISQIIDSILTREKEAQSSSLRKEEEFYDGAISLCAGSCSICSASDCTRKINKECCHKNEMRYSIEALGGNVGLTASKLLGVDLDWIEEGKLPEKFVLVGGILFK